MRHFIYAPVLVGSALAFAPAAHAAFDGDFSLVGVDSPAGYYTAATEVYTLGNWAAAFFPSESGASFVDTTDAPASVTLGADAGPSADLEESTTVLLIEIPESGYVSFTVHVTNDSEGDAAARFEILLSGLGLYSMTDADETHTIGFSTDDPAFDALSGRTLEFRSVTLSAGTESFATNTATISNFTFTPAAIPEPSAFAGFLGLAALGLSGRRRRR